MADNPFKETPKFCFKCGTQVTRIYRVGYYKENGNAVLFETRKCPNEPFFFSNSRHPVTEDDALANRM